MTMDAEGAVRADLPWCVTQCEDCGVLYEAHGDEHGVTRRYRTTASELHYVADSYMCDDCVAALYSVALANDVPMPVCVEEHDCEWKGRSRMNINRETLLEIQGLLDEADYWVTETRPSEWRLFSRVYDTRGSFLAASRKVQGRIAKALSEIDKEAADG